MLANWYFSKYSVNADICNIGQIEAKVLKEAIYFKDPI